MTDRAGPPTPRSEAPYVPEPTDSMLDSARAKRDEAWRAFFVANNLRLCDGAWVAAVHDGFNGGWEARKAAQYREIMGD